MSDGIRDFAVVLATVAACLAGAGIPSPLYGLYRAEHHFGILAQTLLFATYAVALLPALIVAGRWTARVDGRWMTASGVCLVLGADAAFVWDRSLPVLFAARAAQGIGIGVVNAAVAVLALERHPRSDTRAAALGTALATAAGLGVGCVSAGVWAQYWPQPLLWPYVGHAVVLAVMLILIGRLGRGATAHTAPGRPVEWNRSRFRTSCAAAFLAWSLGGLFLAVAPALSGAALGTTNLAVAAGTVGIFFLASAAGQYTVGSGRAGPQPDDVGLWALFLGCCALLAAAASGWAAVLLLSAVVGGFGLGATFTTTLAVVNRLVPPARRGRLLPIYFASVFGGTALPVVAVGAAALRLPLAAAVIAYAAITGCGVAVLIARAAWRRGFARRARSGDRPA
ncbi:hypothetical protein P0W64_03815 [Tsukamurella sp. 8F]|uniref:MFS transporter n=1 Tax=unclassified Tsukamurella TaxID=2633480 RepID=UPI0023B98B8C|nr:MULTISPECIES: MFS transporter [unclassified Tsukamurella]MDF0532563.1 hypothetical protein [Tsukamurella sp. 8J]MDF0585900.1 hypothetical protein [Tsukamurella sp. 8F]